MSFRSAVDPELWIPASAVNGPTASIADYFSAMAGLHKTRDIEIFTYDAGNILSCAESPSIEVPYTPSEVE